MTTHAPPDVTSGPTTDDEIEAIVRRHRALGQTMAQLAEERAALADRFAALVPLGYTVTIDDKPASKMPPNRGFDLDTALRVAMAAGVQIAWVRVPNVDDLKARLKAAGKIDDAMLPGTGKPRVTL